MSRISILVWSDSCVISEITICAVVRIFLKKNKKLLCAIGMLVSFSGSVLDAWGVDCQFWCLNQRFSSRTWGIFHLGRSLLRASDSFFTGCYRKQQLSQVQSLVSSQGSMDSDLLGEWMGCTFAIQFWITGEIICLGFPDNIIDVDCCRTIGLPRNLIFLGWIWVNPSQTAGYVFIFQDMMEVAVILKARRHWWVT